MRSCFKNCSLRSNPKDWKAILIPLPNTTAKSFLPKDPFLPALQSPPQFSSYTKLTHTKCSTVKKQLHTLGLVLYYTLAIIDVCNMATHTHIQNRNLVFTMYLLYIRKKRDNVSEF